jgi:hypothetical protein
MNEAFKFWMMKAAAEIATGLLITALILLAVFLILLPGMVKQLRCKHENISETMACDAVCTRCGKNLGFIGTWRKRRDAR